jgi:hypothetical protein
MGLLGCLVSASATASPPAATRPPATDPAAAAHAALARALDASRHSASPARVLPRLKPSPRTERAVSDAARRAAGNVMLRQRAASDIAAARAAMAEQSGAMAGRLHQALGLSAPPPEAMIGAAGPKGPTTYVPLLFVSSSMPIDELRTYAAQIETTGGALAFRGMPGGLHRVAPMAALSARILRLDPGCSGPACRMRSVSIVVDPIAFRKAGVTAVPALAMVPGDPTTPYCERDGADDETSGRSAILVSGDAALSGMLEEYAHLGGAKEVADAQARLVRR